MLGNAQPAEKRLTGHMGNKGYRQVAATSELWRETEKCAETANTVLKHVWITIIYPICNIFSQYCYDVSYNHKL
jgi:hypothetical protein